MAKTKESKGKLGVVLGARLRDREATLWVNLVESVKKRNHLVDDSKVLRDVLFGDEGIVTDEERRSLREQLRSVPDETRTERSA